MLFDKMKIIFIMLSKQSQAKKSSGVQHLYIQEVEMRNYMRIQEREIKSYMREYQTRERTIGEQRERRRIRLYKKEVYKKENKVK